MDYTPLPRRITIKARATARMWNSKPSSRGELASPVHEEAVLDVAQEPADEQGGANAESRDASQQAGDQAQPAEKPGDAGKHRSKSRDPLAVGQISHGDGEAEALQGAESVGFCHHPRHFIPAVEHVGKPQDHADWFRPPPYEILGQFHGSQA